MLRLSLAHTQLTLSLAAAGASQAFFVPFLAHGGFGPVFFPYAAFSGMPPSIFLKRNPAFRLWGRARDDAFVGKRRAEASVFYMFLLL